MTETSQMMRFLSLGAGVQSSRLLLEAARGERAPYDYALMADTQDEPDEVYAWYAWLVEEVARSPVPIPMKVVTAGKLSDAALKIRVSKKTGNRYIKTLIPAYVAKPNGERALMGRRCTADYKVRILTKWQRKLAAVPRGCKNKMVEVTIGISLDEYIRQKPNDKPWAVNVHPLVDEGITRLDCEQWLWKHYQRVAPKSACRQCPFHGDDYWARMKAMQPEEFAKSVKFDYDLRAAARMQTGTARLQGDVFLHSSLQPLDQVEFSSVPERFQLDLFNNECEGLCGV